MRDAIKFCEKSIIKLESDIQAKEEEIKAKTYKEEFNEIKTTIMTYNEQKVKKLKRNKTTKH